MQTGTPTSLLSEQIHNEYFTGHGQQTAGTASTMDPAVVGADDALAADGGEAVIWPSARVAAYRCFGAAGETLDARGIDIVDAPGEDRFICMKTASAPDPEPTFPPSVDSQDEEDLDIDIGTSPAANFLLSFSPRKARDLPPRTPDGEGEVISGYTLGEIIGHGGFSTIRKGYSSSGATVAIKIVRQTDLEQQDRPNEARKQLEHEAAVWSSLSHEHILPLFAVERTFYAYFFTTLYCPAGSLYDILKREGRPTLPQDDAGTMFRQVVRGLRYLHENVRLVHGDIKLENVLVDEMGMCRITDFGLSKRIGESVSVSASESEDIQEPLKSSKRHGSFAIPVHLSLKRRTGKGRHRPSLPLPYAAQVTDTPYNQGQPHFPAGSLPYASPELLSPGFVYLAPNPAQDIWALGVLLYALMTGRLPFRDSFEPRLQMKILNGAYEEPVGIGHGAEQVLKGCLEVNVEDRWTVDMVDEVAWGVGWGLVDVQGSVENELRWRQPRAGHEYEYHYQGSRPQQGRSTSADQRSGSGSGSHSRSRSRPYPSPHPHAHVLGMHAQLHIPNDSPYSSSPPIHPRRYSPTTHSRNSREGTRLHHFDPSIPEDPSITLSPISSERSLSPPSFSHSRSRRPRLLRRPSSRSKSPPPLSPCSTSPFGSSSTGGAHTTQSEKDRGRKAHRGPATGFVINPNALATQGAASSFINSRQEAALPQSTHANLSPSRSPASTLFPMTPTYQHSSFPVDCQAGTSCILQDIADDQIDESSLELLAHGKRK